jgi:hypothetical protein
LRDLPSLRRPQDQSLADLDHVGIGDLVPGGDILEAQAEAK